jgi:hypothetical protein
MGSVCSRMPRGYMPGGLEHMDTILLTVGITCQAKGCHGVICHKWHLWRCSKTLGKPRTSWVELEQRFMQKPLIDSGLFWGTQRRVMDPARENQRKDEELARNGRTHAWSYVRMAWKQCRHDSMHLLLHINDVFLMEFLFLLCQLSSWDASACLGCGHLTSHTSMIAFQKVDVPRPVGDVSDLMYSLLTRVCVMVNCLRSSEMHWHMPIYVHIVVYRAVAFAHRILYSHHKLGDMDILCAAYVG